MREIKFKGKRKDTGEWIYGDLRHQKVGDFYEIDGWTVNTDTIGQFTGLYDKNGKEIYEGDIVSLNKDLLGSYVVRYDTKNARFSMYHDNYEQAGFNLETMKNYEVIGNIHDNLEFIKE